MLIYIVEREREREREREIEREREHIKTMYFYAIHICVHTYKP